MDADTRLIARLRNQMATLEQLLVVHEQTAAEQFNRSAALLRQLEEKNHALEESEHEKNLALERLRAIVQQLSTPVLELWDETLAVPIIGLLDSQRSAALTTRLLQDVNRLQARFVVLDITGVEAMDTSTADHLVRLARAVELLGARCMLTGVQPAVAQTLAQLGADLGSLTTFSKLKDGLRECLRKGPGDASAPASQRRAVPGRR